MFFYLPPGLKKMANLGIHGYLGNLERRWNPQDSTALPRRNLSSGGSIPVDPKAERV